MLFLNGYTIMALSQKESLFMSVLIVDWASLMPMGSSIQSSLFRWGVKDR
jgi:hypothetical protein